MPRRIFAASSVTNTTGAPLRLTFHADNTTGRRETDMWTVDGSNNLSERISNGIILTDAVGAYSAFAGPDDIDVLYVVKHDSSTRTSITATGTVASFSASAARSDLGLGSLATLSTVGVANLSATGTPSSSTYLRGDNTWATAGGSVSTAYVVGIALALG